MNGTLATLHFIISTYVDEVIATYQQRVGSKIVAVDQHAMIISELVVIYYHRSRLIQINAILVLRRATRIKSDKLAIGNREVRASGTASVNAVPLVSNGSAADCDGRCGSDLDSWRIRVG